MAKRKKHHNQFKCPCCQQLQYSGNLEKSLELLKSYYKTTMPSYYQSFKSDIINSFANEDLIWACDDCFRKGKAIPSDPKKMFNGGEVQLVYFDSKMNCERCKGDFIFSKKEKQFWYKGLMFYVDAKPKNCVKCRSVVRKEKKDNTRLSELLENKADLTKEQLEEVSQIYFRMGKEERMKMYRTLAEKKNQ